MINIVLLGLVGVTGLPAVLAVAPYMIEDQLTSNQLISEQLMMEDMDSHLLMLSGQVYTEPPCNGQEIISCELAQVNWELIENNSNIVLPNGNQLNFTYLEESRKLDMSNGNPVTLVYKGEFGNEAVLTYKKHSLYGRVILNDDRTFIIETVAEGVVWAEIDQSVWTSEHHPMEANLTYDAISLDRMEILQAQGRADTTTVVEFTVTVYYTQIFKQSTADPATFIDQVIAETNEGYKNSLVPIRVRLLCIQESSIPDGQDSTNTLNQFTRSQNTLNDVRQSADATILLVNAFNNAGSCGVNWFNTISSGQTIGTVAKGCALGYFSFGHEMGHGFGLAHDRRVADTSSNNYAYGYVMAPGLYRSIMAYSTAGEKRVNYYSSPLIKYQGYATGTSTADNARTLVENRFAVAAIGDESMSCSGTSASVTSPPTSVTLPPTSVTSPQTTTVSTSCVDKFSNCKDYINHCWHPDVSSGCQLTCRLCPGMTPVSSTVCFDRYSNCVSLARAGYCYSQRVYESCSSACGLC